MEEIIKSRQIACKKCNSSLKIMKVSILMLFICIFSLTAENVYTQQKELSLELRNVNIIKAISEIEKTSDYVFLITDEARTELKKKISVSVNRESIQDILETILKGTDLGYRVVERQVSLYKNPESSVSNAAAAIAKEIEQQKKRIAGKVTDNEGVPVIGANIVEEGTTNGTVTDADGSFSLSVEENATLIISYIGYVTQNIPTSGKTTINIILKEDTEALEEVVVVGYGTQRKVNLTGAVGVVSGEDITSKATTDVLSAIQGQLSGVTVLRSSGKPGSETGGTSAIRIRGFSSSNEAHALVLIDGVEGDLESLNPGDIESISVLKDAASASIYGARAAAGVILVTTKKGVEQRAKVSYSGSFGINTPGNMPKRIPVWEEIEIVNLLRVC